MVVIQAQSAAGSAKMTNPRSRKPGAAAAVMAGLMLDDLGMIQDCNPESEALFKYRRSQLVSQHVSLLLPQLEESKLIQNGQPNARLCFLSRTGHHFQAITRKGEGFPCKLFFNVLDSTGYGQMLLIVRPVETAISEEGEHTRKA
ncbi:MAG: hypothetical protein D4S02_05015 [Rhodocyclaceae bacterium]|nr:MAG: hypothetical protein D4S02_05015 [Rhodocyclaceae bacterium]